MPKTKRTRKEKILATERKIEHAYTFVAADSSEPVKNQTKKSNDTESLGSFFHYDQRLIYKDLVKTILISSAIIASLLGISLYIQ